MGANAGAQEQDELKLNEEHDIGFMRREWIVQRIGWVVMALLVIAALIGLLGSPGVISTARVTSPDGAITLDYGRFERHHAPSELTIDVSSSATQNGNVRIAFSLDYAEQLTIDTFVPEPESVEVSTDQIVYVFAANEAGEPMRITLKYEHDGYWRVHGEVGLAGGEPVEFTQWVLP